MQMDFGVKRGKILTQFASAVEAMAYCQAVLGSMLMIRSATGWRRIF
jgi:hypothetical protein